MEHLTLLFRSLETIAKAIALPPALRELGIKAAAARQAGDEVTHEKSDAAHVI